MFMRRFPKNIKSFQHTTYHTNFKFDREKILILRLTQQDTLIKTLLEENHQLWVTLNKHQTVTHNHQINKPLRTLETSIIHS